MFLPIGIHAEVVALAYRRNICSFHDRRKRLLMNFGEFRIMVEQVIHDHHRKRCVWVLLCQRVIAVSVCLYQLGEPWNLKQYRGSLIKIVLKSME